MKIIFVFFAVFFVTATLIAQEWQELKGEHFIVYFIQDKDFASDILYKAEKDYDRIASDLGYARYSNFWTWANRVKIYIYPDSTSYHGASAQPEWSEGMADYTNKRILSYSGSSDFIESILPHEIAHLIFRDFIGFESEIPLWLDEGVAQWEENTKKDMIKRTAKEFLKDGTWLSLKDMMDLDVRHLEDTDKIHLRTTFIDDKPNFIVIDGKNLVNLYYLQSASLVGFLIERYGADNFTNFCRRLRDGKILEDALISAYSTYLRDLVDLENKWMQYLREE